MSGSTESIVVETAPPPGHPVRLNAGHITALTLCCLFVGVAILLSLICYRRKKTTRNAALSSKKDQRKKQITNRSSTLKSDNSDHPYEKPWTYRAETGASSARVSTQDGQQYVGLKGQSLPHQYERLAQRSTKSNRPSGAHHYEVLEGSTEDGSSAYYFKLDQNARERKSGEMGSASGIDRPYDEINIGPVRTRTRQSENVKSDAPQNEYYFKLEKSVRDDKEFIPGSNFVCDESRGDRGSNSLNADVDKKGDVKSKQAIIPQNTGTNSFNYNRLNRALGTPRSEDENSNEYGKLVSLLASKTAPSSGTSGYRAVRAERDPVQSDDCDFNKLDRGVEQDLASSDGEVTSSNEELSSELPIEL